MKLIRPGMGTENASSLLTVLVLMQRPQTVLEIGAGDSTIALARALQEAVSAWVDDRSALDAPEWSERVALLDPAHVPSAYEPRLITVDDFSGEGTSAELAWEQLLAADIRPDTVEFIEQDFFTIADDAWEEWGPVDLAWIDAGTPADDVRFVTEIWDRVRPGGYVVLHEPTLLTTATRGPEVRLETVRSPLWEELSSRVGADFELVTLPEFHKYRQSGVGLVRKLTPQERGVRRGSLQRELLVLGEPPIRNDLLSAGRTATEIDPAAALVAVLRDLDSRRVLAAVVLGAESVTAVVDRTGLPVKSVGRAVNRLLAAGLISSVEGALRAADEPWHDTLPVDRRDRSNLTDAQLESPDVLARIAQMFVPGRPYSEATVSRMCATVSPDFARLRRKLVDEGFVTRSGNQYERAC